MLYLIFKIVWSGFTKPFRMFNRKIRNKTKSSIWSVFKFAFKTVIIFFCFMTVVLMTVTTVSNSKPNAGDKVTVNRVDTQVEEELYPDNGDGSINGLNLLLIDKIETEGYVKEMLSLYRDSYQGDLDDYAIRLSVEGLLGMQVNETGTYSGTTIPKSYIPISGSTIQWKTAYGSFPAEALTLNNINHNVIDSSYRGGHSVSGGLPYSVNGINPTGGDSADEDINVFQVRYSRFGIFGGSYPASNINGWKESTGRVSDPFYLPDNLTYINAELQNIASKYFPSQSTEDLKSKVDGIDDKLWNLMYSIYHNGGSAILSNHAGMGAYYTKDKVKVSGYEEDYVTSFKEILTDFESFNQNVSPKYYSSPVGRVYATVGLVTEGWVLTQNAYNFLYNNYKDSMMTSAYNEITGESKSDSEVKSYLQSKVGSLPFDSSTCSSVYGLDKNTLDGNKNGSLFRVRDRTSDAYNAGTNQVIQFLNVINVGHIQCSVYGGYYIYGSMLKYAGVDVDPTNPSDYMNTISDGEWKPSGETDWLKELGVDLNKLSTNRVAYLNEAKKWLGSWYLWGGMEAPEKDSSGNWISGNGKGFDCSRYTQYVALQSLGVDISRTTYTQIVNSNLDTIDRTEAKPGDIIYYYNGSPSATHHVAIFLKDNGDGTDLIMHAPQTGDVIKIANRSNNPNKTVYRRIKVIDN